MLLKKLGRIHSQTQLSLIVILKVNLNVEQFYFDITIRTSFKRCMIELKTRRSEEKFNFDFCSDHILFFIQIKRNLIYFLNCGRANQ